MRRTVALVDLVAVGSFVAAGRASHHHGETVTGFLATAWPFAVGLAAGWAIVARRPPAAAATGAAVCASTVAVGMAFRVVAGQGTAASFVGVSLGYLGAWMVGGRMILSRVWRPTVRKGGSGRR